MALAGLIAAGELTRDEEVPASPVLRAIIDGFKNSKASTIDGRVSAALEAIKAVAPEPRLDGSQAEPPEGDFWHTLDVIADASIESADTEEGLSGAGDSEIVSAVTQVERLAGVSGTEARRNSLAALSAGRRDTNATIPITPPPMTAAELRLQIDALVERLAA